MISFRNLSKDDFFTLYTWLKVPHVKEFWYQNESFTYNDIVEKYTKRLKEGVVD